MSVNAVSQSPTSISSIGRGVLEIPFDRVESEHRNVIPVTRSNVASFLDGKISADQTERLED